MGNDAYPKSSSCKSWSSRDFCWSLHESSSSRSRTSSLKFLVIGVTPRNPSILVEGGQYKQVRPQSLSYDIVQDEGKPSSKTRTVNSIVTHMLSAFGMLRQTVCASSSLLLTDSRGASIRMRHPKQHFPLVTPEQSGMYPNLPTSPHAFTKFILPTICEIVILTKAHC